MENVIRAPVEPDEMLPAVAQGAIGIEARSGDEAVGALLAPIDDAATGLALAAERAFLAGLDGSCRTPIGGLAVPARGGLWFRGEIIRPDGSERLATERRGPADGAAAMGRDAAEELRGRAGPGFFDAGGPRVKVLLTRPAGEDARVAEMLAPLGSSASTGR